MLNPSSTFVHQYHGYWDTKPDAVCGVSVYERGVLPPVVILTELPENISTSVTNLIEQIAAEVCSARWPERLRAWSPGEDAPVVVIEHYPANPAMPWDRALGVDRYSVVDFASWNVGRRFRSGRETVSFGSASWRHLSANDVLLIYRVNPPRTPLRQKSCIEAQR